MVGGRRPNGRAALRRQAGPRIAAMLFGRAGSVAVPGKNVKRILGRPSLHYALMAACASGIVTDLYVSTDSEEIIRLAAPFGAQPIQRPARLASSAALLEDAIAYTFERIDRQAAGDYDLYLVLLCNAVTVLPARIREAAAILRGDASIDAVTTGAKWNMFSPVRAWALDHKAGTLLTSYVPLDVLGRSVRVICDRDQSTDCYFCDHSFTLVRREVLASMAEQRGPFKWMGRRIRLIEQVPGSGDVDLPWQVPVVEWWLKEHGFTTARVPYAWRPLRAGGGVTHRAATRWRRRHPEPLEA